MRFTVYGRAQAGAEPKMPEPTIPGATAHMEACGYDTGKKIVLTGTDFNGKKFRKEAKSVYGAFATMRAVAGLTRAWHIREDGTRRLLISKN